MAGGFEAFDRAKFEKNQAAAPAAELSSKRKCVLVLAVLLFHNEIHDQTEKCKVKRLHWFKKRKYSAEPNLPSQQP